MKRVLRICIAVYGCVGAAHAAFAQPERLTPTSPLSHPSASIDFAGLPPFGYTRLTTTDAYGRTIECYLSASRSDEPLPLVVSVQGSGCGSVFGMTDDGQVYGGLQNIVLGAFGGRVRVLVVEKPGVSFADQPDRPGVAEGCPEVFLEEHTVPRWTEALRAAIAHTVTQPGVDPDRVLILGHSEGADMAAHVAAADPTLASHIALLAGAGVSQLFDMMLLAGQPRADGEPEADRNARVLEVLETWQRIAADPDSTTMMAWGHPYRRWSSFMANSSAASLERIATTTPMFLAQGTADRSSPIE
ncbi:MAG: alpha/beta hydrolase family protein, partial [Phycisphaerales bacterium JB041]